MIMPPAAPAVAGPSKGNVIKITVASLALVAAASLIVWNMIPEPLAVGGAPAVEAPAEPAPQKVAEKAPGTPGAPGASGGPTAQTPGSNPTQLPARGNYRIAPEK